MKLKKHHKHIGFWLAAAVYFAMPVSHPPLCSTPKVAGQANERLISEQVSRPFQTALLSVFSLQQYPECYAPLRRSETFVGWPDSIAQALRKQSYQSYERWNTLLARFASALCIALAVRHYLLRTRKDKK